VIYLENEKGKFRVTTHNKDNSWDIQSWAICDIVYAFNNGGFFICTVAEKLNDSLFQISPIGLPPTVRYFSPNCFPKFYNIYSLIPEENVAVLRSNKHTQVDDISLREEMVKNNIRAKMSEPGPSQELTKILKPAPPTTAPRK